MTDSSLKSPIVSAEQDHENSCDRSGTLVVADMKARQSAKIRSIGKALADAGYLSLDQQAKVLGLHRSTAWTILKANHKSSGLSAVVINRMLAAPGLPLAARARILEYIEEKTAGLYGDNKLRLRKFTARVAINGADLGAGAGERIRNIATPQDRLIEFRTRRRSRLGA